MKILKDGRRKESALKICSNCDGLLVFSELLEGSQLLSAAIFFLNPEILTVGL